MKLHELKKSLSAKQDPVEKVALARKVGLYLTDAPVNNGDRDVVEDVAQTLAEDISLEVRKTLAYELRRARTLPRELAERIARDVAEVASPFLAQTPVFDPDTLAALARELEESLKITIARRRKVPGVVAVAIAETGGERSVTFLVRNPGAEMTDASPRVVDRFSGNRAMMDHLSERADLPLAVVDRLISCVSDACRAALVDRYGVDSPTADATTASARGTNLAHWVAGASRGALNEYIRQLHERGAITDRLIIDITRHGGVRFFESLMAFWTGIDVDRIEALTRSADERYIRKLLHKAGIKGKRAGKIAHSLEEGLSAIEALYAGEQAPDTPDSPDSSEQ